jgi:hypothetical protein
VPVVARVVGVEVNDADVASAAGLLGRVAVP